MKKLLYVLYSTGLFFMSTKPALATSYNITNYTNNTLQLITLIASISTVFFLIKGGYHYITSTGHPESLATAKKTIQNALIGLTIILGSNIIISLLQHTLISPIPSNNISPSPINSLAAQTPNNSTSQVLLNAISAILQNILQNGTKPIVDAIIGYLTTTPSLLNNIVVVHFWLVTVGIVDTLFVLIVAFLGLHFMSASTFGFAEIELKHLLPRIGLSFLGANISLFLTDYMITTTNALVNEVIQSTGGLDHTWIVDAINPATILNGTTPLITLFFFLAFLIISVMLLLMYIIRLIIIALAGVLSPFIFLMWAIPKLSEFAEIAVKGYFVTVFTIFIHVVVIQLATSFLTLPEQNGNPLLSISIAIGLLLTLLKIPTWLFQMTFYTSRMSSITHIGGQMMNTLSHRFGSSNSENYQNPYGANDNIRESGRYINV